MLLCLSDPAYNLPMESPKNTLARQLIDGWGQKCARPGVWDYSLLHLDGNKGDWRVPVPMVTGLSSSYRYMHAHHFRDVLVQASNQTRDNPWNYYAYAEVIWHVDKPATEILRDFFTGYYQEAARPMLDYYQTMEQYQIAHDISLRGEAITFSYCPTPEAFPPQMLTAMERCLRNAEGAAHSWVVKQRVADARRGFTWTQQYLQRAY